jgi:predicted esterase/catechol 2,3-dioxygenase-like lactoylglutathione lyase family enzyme
VNNSHAITGIHHITSIVGSPSENLSFYEGFLGLRLVKQTVNFDDPFTYHLYYGDRHGAPGTIFTFFPWPRAGRGAQGAGMIAATTFAVPSGSLALWRQWLHDNDINTETETRFGEEVLRFADPHGLPLELAESTAVTSGDDDSVPHRFPIGAIHAATSLVQVDHGTVELLRDIMGLVPGGHDGNRHRFIAGSQFLDVVVDDTKRPGVQGAGTVHHIAFRAENETMLTQWQAALRANGYPVTEVRDRKYFKSIYFHEPGGVLFEIATDPPGFAIDEPLETLGERLMLPDQYEPMRSAITNRLPELRKPGFVYRFVAGDNNDHANTIIALHGTGGDESDLIDLVRDIDRHAAIISPRGRVKENGMNRFFKRLAMGVLDEEDIVRQGNDLAKFLTFTAQRYQRGQDNLSALGYSNGANMGAALLFLHPGLLARAILLRPMAPFTTPPPADLSRTSVLILRGTRDTVINSGSTDQLVHNLRDCGARVEVETIDAGHELTADDISRARQWLAHQTATSAVAP